MDKVRVRCPTCRKIYKVDEKHLGKKGRCKTCDLSFVLSRTGEQGGDAAVLAPEWTDGQRILDEFVVAGKLGQGGMGSVYLLENRTNGSHFAVKKTLFRTENSRRNFLAELVT